MFAGGLQLGRDQVDARLALRAANSLGLRATSLICYFLGRNSTGRRFHRDPLQKWLLGVQLNDSVKNAVIVFC